MRVLLDTHTLIWWYLDRPELSRTADAILRDEANIAMVSAASIFEIAVKHRIGKLPQIAELLNDLDALLDQQMFETLNITTQHARRAGLLAGPHRDPFDRMLAAQAIVDNLVLISSDTALDQFGVQRLW